MRREDESWDFFESWAPEIRGDSFVFRGFHTQSIGNEIESSQFRCFWTKSNVIYYENSIFCTLKKVIMFFNVGTILEYCSLNFFGFAFSFFKQTLLQRTCFSLESSSRLLLWGDTVDGRNTANHLGCFPKTFVNNGISTTNLNWCRISEPSTGAFAGFQ